MSVDASNAAVKALYDIYWQSNNDNKNLIMSKLAAFKNVNSIISFLEDAWQAPGGDLFEISKKLDFLCQYTIEIRKNISPEVAHAIFNVFMGIAKQNPLPISYENYSKFLAVLIPAVKTKGELSISTNLKTLDPQTALFPLVHFVLFYQDNLLPFVDMMLAEVKKGQSITAQSVWNETMCILLRAKASSKFDRLKVFSAVDFALASVGFTESKINLIQASFRYFNNQEIGQLMRIHFQAISRKVVAKTPQAAQLKLLNVVCAYYDISDEKEQLLLDTFRYLIPSIIFCDKYEKILVKLCNKVDKQLLKTVIQKSKDVEGIAKTMMFIASKYPDHDTISILLSSDSSNDKEIAKAKYQFIVDMINRGDFLVDFTIFLFSILNVEDFDLIVKAANEEKRVYIVNAIRYMQRAVDRQKIIKILQTLHSFKELPVFSVKEATDTAATLISEYFTMKIEEKEFQLFLKYLYEVSTAKEESVFNFELQNEQEAPAFPIFIKEFFSDEKYQNWRSEIFELTLQRIRRADQTICITTIALATDGTTFDQCYLFVKSDPNLLASFFAAAMLNIEKETVDFIIALIDQNEKNKSFLSSIFGSSSSSGVQFRKVLLQMFTIVKDFIKPTEQCFDLLHVVYNENLIYSDFEQLCDASVAIIKRLEINEDLTYFIDRVCNNATRINKEVTKDTLCVMLNKNLRIKTSLAERVCTTWLNILPYIEVKEPIFEQNFLRKVYFQTTSPVMQTNILQRLQTNQNCYNYYLCLRNVLETEGVDKSLGRKALHIFIANILNKNESISSICVEFIQKVLGMSSALPEKDGQDIDVYRSFFNDIETCLSTDFDEEISITEKLFAQQATESSSLFFLSLIQRSSKEILTKHTEVLVSFLNATSDNQNIIISNCVTKVIKTINEINQKLLLMSYITESACQFSSDIIRIIIKAPLFANIFYETVDFFAEKSFKKLNISLVSKLTMLLNCCIKEAIINPDSKSVRALLVLIAMTYICEPKEKYDVIAKQKTQLREAAFSIFPSFRSLPSNDSFRLDMRSGSEGFLNTVCSIIYMVTAIMKELDIHKLANEIVKLQKTELSLLDLFFCTSIVKNNTLQNDDDFRTMIAKNFSNTLGEKNISNSEKVLVIKAIITNINKQFMSFINQNQVRFVYIAFNQFLSSIKDQELKKSEIVVTYMEILLTVDSEYFLNDAKVITENINRVIGQNIKIIFDDTFVSVMNKFVKILSVPGSFAKSFPSAFIELSSALLKNKENAVNLIKNVSRFYDSNQKDQDIDRIIEEFYKEAMLAVGALYINAVNTAVTAASELPELTKNDLTVLQKIVYPLTEQHANKQGVLDKFTELMTKVALSEGYEQEIRRYAVTIIAGLSHQR